MNKPKNQCAPTILLLIGVFFWGVTFVLIKESLETIDAFSFIAFRFFIAVLILFVIFFRRFSDINLEIIKKGVIIGYVLGISFIFQTIGIKYTTASNAAFITGLCVVIVPIYVAFIDRKLPGLIQILSIIAAFIGLGLLTLKDGYSVNRGDLWALLCAFTFAAHILMVGRMINHIDAALFSIVQLLTVGVVSCAAGLVVNGNISVPENPAVWRSIIFCAVFGSAYVLTVQAQYQKYISEVKAAMIYATEPVFAAVVACIYLGEIITVRIAAGGILIFAAMLVTDVSRDKSRHAK